MDNNVVTPEQQVLNQLEDTLRARLNAPDAEAAILFAQHLFRAASSEDLQPSRLDALYATTVSFWKFIQQHDRKVPKVRVFNPDYDEHGWHSNHTVVQILNLDMPFLVDSIRMELNRHGRAIHSLLNSRLPVSRNESGMLSGIADGPGTGSAALDESLIFLEIDRDSDPGALELLRTDLIQVMQEVRAAVDDFQAMRDRMMEIRDALGRGIARQSSPTEGDLQESLAYLDWLLKDHFVFLGYEEFALGGQGDAMMLTGVPDSSLGALRRGLSGNRQAPDEQACLATAPVLRFGKDRQRSRVHRPAYRDLVVIKRFDEQGTLCGEHRFYGLYTFRVFCASPDTIPLVRRKVADLLSRTGFKPGGHNHKAVLRILNDMPQEELILTGTQQLYQTTMGVFNVRERHRACLFIRRDEDGRYYSCLYYVPRDLYNTSLRMRVHELLMKSFQAYDSDVTAQVSVSTLSRTHFVLYVDPQAQSDIDLAAIEAKVLEISRSWEDDLQRNLVEVCGEELGSRYASLFHGAFSATYQEHFAPGNTVRDIQRLSELDSPGAIAMSFYQSVEQAPDRLRLKLFKADDSLVLSDVVPILENLGMQVIGEHPYRVRRRDGNTYWIHDFTLRSDSGVAIDLHKVKPLLQESFARIWKGLAENDAFNRLVVRANLGWREIALLRAYARYIRQIRFGFSQPFIADTLARHMPVTQLLVESFHVRFEPARQDDLNIGVAQGLDSRILEALEAVESLDDDKILRRYRELINATLRTNYFQREADGARKAYFSFKLDPKAIPGLPRPLPMFEVFVYSPRVEGVHLRGGKVARGGLRWSDRMEDYRTEVLGLVKAQQVKNSVIVPVGAKGCFIAKHLSASDSREQVQAEGVACYQTYIRGLLDITDNLDAGTVVPPRDVVRYDDDDPYLVVAADKGTATFSDIANTISGEYGFWLGDAFASGGSQGYDHKKMGITARGAWESVKRHFRERGLNTQTDPFSVVGIGDMAGDVFGNGMLLSDTIRLVGAFNHQHIFIDPQPDAASAYAERKRLFELPRSTWPDYSVDLISKGGGVFSRSAKWISVSPEMRALFAIDADRLAPNDLIRALLKAPVDMIWNGGIGTYVKASHEHHTDVGDKANDGLRIDGRELRCRVLGEGGNLGFTQLGRIEFALQGGASNTDFIDNAGGVDCSDHEVNIKIQLNELVAQGDMTPKQRNQLLREMTEEVAELVLANNYRQVEGLSMVEQHAREALDEYIHLIHGMENAGKLDRALEFLPGDKELAERKEQGAGLTRPELAVLISYAKNELKQSLIDSWITDDPYLSGEMETAFPALLLKAFPEAVRNHRLRREITATQIANDLVNRMGATFARKLRRATGADYGQIAAAYLIIREVYGIDQRWKQIQALDYQVPAQIQALMLKELIALITRGSQWVLRQRRNSLDITGCVNTYKPKIDQTVSSVDQLQQTIPPADRWNRMHQQFTEAGVPALLSAYTAASAGLYWLLDITEAATALQRPLSEVSAVYFRLGECLELPWLDQQIRTYPANTHWQALARNSYRDGLDIQQRALTISVLSDEQASATAQSAIDAWMARNQGFVSRWQSLLADMQRAPLIDCAAFSVAINVLREAS